MTARPILLFSYGTVQDRQVQLAHFGRELTGRADACQRVAVKLKSGVEA